MLEQNLTWIGCCSTVQGAATGVVRRRFSAYVQSQMFGLAKLFEAEDLAVVATRAGMVENGTCVPNSIPLPIQSDVPVRIFLCRPGYSRLHASRNKWELNCHGRLPSA